MESSDFAGKSVEELKEIKRKLLLSRSEAQRVATETTSPLGRRMLDRKKLELESLRKRYLDIDTTQDQQSVVLALAVTQSYEKQVLSDIAYFNEPEKLIEGLDRDISLCNDAIEARENTDRLSR